MQDQAIYIMHLSSVVGLVLVGLVAWAAVLGARMAGSRLGHRVSMGALAVLAALPGYIWASWALAASNSAVREMGREYLGILAIMLLVTYVCSALFAEAEDC